MHYSEGLGLYLKGDYQGAVTCFDHALANDPPKGILADILYKKGDALYELRRFEEAVICCDKALALRPDDADVWNQKGMALVRLQKWAEGISCFRKAIASDSECIPALLNLGEALLGTGQAQGAREALDHFGKVIALDPICVSAWVGKATAHSSLQQWADEIACHDRVLQLVPGDSKTEARRDLAALRLSGNAQAEFRLNNLLGKYLGGIPQGVDPSIDSGRTGNFNRVCFIYTDSESAYEVFETLRAAISRVLTRHESTTDTGEKHQLSLAYIWLYALSQLCMGMLEDREITSAKREEVVQLLRSARGKCVVPEDASYFETAIEECRG